MARLNEKGFGLVQVMISAAIMGILMSTFASVVISQNKQNKSLQEVLASMDLQKMLVASLADGSVCKRILNSPTARTFDSTAVSPTHPQRISVLKIPISAGVGSPLAAEVGSTASPYSNSLIVKSIYLNITAGSGNQYLGNWVVEFDNNKTVRSIKPLSAATILTVDKTNPTAAKITSCQGEGGGSLAWIEFVPLAHMGNSCNQLVTLMNTISGTPMAPFDFVGGGQYMVGGLGSWTLQVIEGDCSPMSNSPSRVFGQVARDSNNQVLKNYFRVRP